MASVTSIATTSPPSTHTLFSIPQELQDEIFNFAYPREGEMNVICREDWRRRESERKRQDRKNYVKRPFPKSKVDDFMISKKFFLAASRAWVGNQHFAELKPELHGIMSAFIRVGTVTGILPSWLAAAPHLKSLRFRVSAVAFSNIEEDIVVTEDKLTDSDFEILMRASELEHFRGLADFDMVPANDLWLSATEREVFLDNIARFSNYARLRVTQHRSEDFEDLIPYRVTTSADTRFDPLYLGSAVEATTSILGWSLESAGARRLLRNRGLDEDDRPRADRTDTTPQCQLTASKLQSTSQPEQEGESLPSEGGSTSTASPDIPMRVEHGPAEAERLSSNSALATALFFMAVLWWQYLILRRGCE
ncbi:hypothetical protein EJ03DRAFT_193211 [Teratosphaeria nubilosa]|uniref:F-box domain-containing protein n=1 Tax=Teratosphaeria nubilosa TaxID=161662 RepID=A0A6G1L091_9PEZI|nr:hypothetical protein EJ03DRAFT_193211 [Teratosphaeria nubilosa]